MKSEGPVAVAVDPIKDGEFRRILGISFFVGKASEAVARMKRGGLLVVPSAPVLKDMTTNRAAGRPSSTPILSLPIVALWFCSGTGLRMIAFRNCRT